jgi:hypothetical protein
LISAIASAQSYYFIHLKKKIKICVDIALVAVLLCQMPYFLVGERIHERLGVVFLVLVLVHVALNRAAFRAMFRRFWSSPLRLVNCLTTALAGAALMALVASAPYISKHVLVFPFITGGAGLARTAHLLSAYWGFVLFSLHLGLHLEKAVRPARLGAGSRGASKKPAPLALIATLIVAIFGLKAFMAGDIASYLFLRQQFVFLDPDIPLWKVFADNLAMMGALAATTFWLGRFLRSKRF